MTTKDHSATNPYRIGQQVQLVPSWGAYQPTIIGEVTSLTATQVGVKRPDRMSEIRYRVSDGIAVSKYDQQFPMYRVQPMPEEEKAQ